MPKDTSKITVRDIADWCADISAQHDVEIVTEAVTKIIDGRAEAQFTVSAHTRSPEGRGAAVASRAFIFPTVHHRTLTGAWLGAILSLDQELTAVAALRKMRA